MRPKKIILCVDSNEQQLSELKFMLATNGYQVLSASSGKEAVAIFSAAPVIDLVLVEFIAGMTAERLIEQLKRTRIYTPVVLFGDTSSAICMADIVIDRKKCSTIELLERIHVMAARKRGSRKGSASAMRCAHPTKTQCLQQSAF